jgi:hypothetical protein
MAKSNTWSAAMNCPSCGVETHEETKFCPSCGKPMDLEAKALCDSCMGAHPGGALEIVDGRRLCPLCRDREDRKREGVPSAGPARMLHSAREYKGHQTYGTKPPGVSLLAIASLVSAFLCPFAGIPAVVLGVIAIYRIRSRPDELVGSGLAAAGIVLGGLTLAFFAVVAVVFAPMAQSIQEDFYGTMVRAEMENIKQCEKQYFVQYGEYADLEQLAAAELWSPGDTSVPGYRFEVAKQTAGFEVRATPVGKSRGYHYFLDEMGGFHREKGKPATLKSPLFRPKPMKVRQKPVRRAPS